MPKYIYECIGENGGCGHVWDFTCLMSELDDKKPKSCPQCKKRKPIAQRYGNINVSVPKTLGSLADRNARTLSLDEKHHLDTKHNEYKKAPPSWQPTPDGMVHKPSIKRTKK